MKKEEKMRRKMMAKDLSAEKIDELRKEHDKYASKDDYQDILATEDCFTLGNVRSVEKDK